MIDDYDFPEESEEYEQRVPDLYFEGAQTEIRDLYEKKQRQCLLFETDASKIREKILSLGYQ